MGEYEIVAHTADIGLRVEASTPEELFRTAFLGMSNIMKRDFCQERASNAVEERISVASLDQNSLLVDFLNEVLALANEDKAVFCKVDFDSLTDRNLEAEISGDSVDDFDEDIKAATYHGAMISTNDKGDLEVTVLFDI